MEHDNCVGQVRKRRTGRCLDGKTTSSNEPWSRKKSYRINGLTPKAFGDTRTSDSGIDTSPDQDLSAAFRSTDPDSRYLGRRLSRLRRNCAITRPRRHPMVGP